MRKLTSGENLISEMSNYFEFLSSNAVNRDGGLWTSPYLDAWGLGLLITHTIPCFTKDGRYGRYQTLNLSRLNLNMIQTAQVQFLDL